MAPLYAIASLAANHLPREIDALQQPHAFGRMSVRRPNTFGDVSWCRADVVDKRVEDGAHVVDLALRVENQLGEVTAKGVETVARPSKSRFV